MWLFFSFPVLRSSCGYEQCIRDLHLGFLGQGSLTFWSVSKLTWPRAVRGRGHSRNCIRAYRITPSPSPAPLHPARSTRFTAALRRGRGGGGGGAGRGRALYAPHSPAKGGGREGAQRMNGTDDRWRTLLRSGRGGRSERPLFLPSQRRSPPPSRGARRGRGLGRKEPGKGGVGAGRRGVGGGECGSGGPPAVSSGGAVRRGRDSNLTVWHPCSPQPVRQ